MKTLAVRLACLGAVILLLDRPADGQETWREEYAEAMLGKLGGAHLDRDPETQRVEGVALVNVGPTNTALSLAAQLPALEELEVVALPWQHFDDRGLAYLRGMTQLEQLQIVGPHITNRGMAYLNGLTNIDQLAIDAPISDAGLVALRNMTRLRLLDLYGTRVTGPGLANLTALEQLEFLGLDHTGVGNEGVQDVANLNTLRTLLLRDTRVGDQGLAALASLPNLERLYLDRTPVTTAGLANLNGSVDPQLMTFAGPTQLRRLSLQGAPYLRGEDLQSLANLYGLPYFEQLNLQETPLGRNRERLERLLRAQRVVEHWRTLQGFGGAGPIVRFDEDLNLYGLYYIAPAFSPTTDTLDELANYPPTTLQELSLRDAFLQNDDLADIAKLSGLRKLNLYRTRIGDEGLQQLAPLENLEYLYLDEDNTLVTDEGIAALKEAIPGLEVVRLP